MLKSGLVGVAKIVDISHNECMVTINLSASDTKIKEVISFSENSDAVGSVMKDLGEMYPNVRIVDRDEFDVRVDLQRANASSSEM